MKIRDISNGFLVAEILSRYYPNKVNISGFGTGSSFEERTTNWSYIKKIFLKSDLPINDDLINKLIHQAPNVAFDFLIQLYKALTKKE